MGMRKREWAWENVTVQGQHNFVDQLHSLSVSEPKQGKRTAG